MILRKIPAKTHAQILFPGCLGGQLPRSACGDRVPDEGTGEGATAQWPFKWPSAQVGHAKSIFGRPTMAYGVHITLFDCGSSESP